MSKRISYGKNTPQSFRESLRFDRECPYRIRCKDFMNDDIAPLHYAETIEVDVCCQVTGEVIIGNERLEINGNMVFVMPPGTVHATTIRKGEGHVYVLHISLDELSAFVNVPALMELSGKTFSGMDYICPEFDKIHSLVLEMIERDADPFARTRALMDILSLLAEQMPVQTVSAPMPLKIRRGELHRILRWTEERFTEPILLEQAASVVGFTRNYFCTWFKANTGLTYNHYLNNLRINHACRLLVQTGSISQACYDSGFQDMSYFIQVFKRTQGCTPKAYLRNVDQEKNF